MWLLGEAAGGRSGRVPRYAVPIAAVGSVCTPLFMILMGVFQAFSLDKIGIPGPRTSDPAP